MIKSIGIFTANRAEKGLLEPVYNALKQAGFTVVWMNIPQGDSLAILAAAEATHKLLNSVLFDFAIVPCDRQEMAGVALVLFSRTMPFAQFHGGDVGSGTHDEVYRWIISRCASLHFANSPESGQNLVRSGEEPWRVHVIGSTAFDDVELDDSIVFGNNRLVNPKEPFDLFLVHPDTYSMEQTHKDMLEALGKIDKPTVFIGSNKDTNYGVVDMDISNFLDGLGKKRYFGQFENRYPYIVEGLPRPQFLSLMKYCSRFITNSSSAIYELPRFGGMDKWVNIGKRNADRKPLEHVETGGAKKIAEILKNLDVDTLTLLRKKFTH